jgi:hypothetical protein
VPITPAAKKYFLQRYKNYSITHHAETALKINRKHFLGNFIYVLLDNNLEKFELKPPTRTSSKAWGASQIHYESICIVLPRNFDHFFVDQPNLQRLGFFLEGLFKEHMIHYIDINSSLGLSALQAVDRFSRSFGIEENDYGQDSMYRYYSRFGKTNMKNQAVA